MEYLQLKEAKESDYEPSWLEMNIIKMNKVYFKELK